MASLIRISGEDPGDVIELQTGENRFGTGKSCDFIVDHSSVSLSHCDLVVDETGLTVRDLGAPNGTLVDGKPITEARVKIGQVIQMGELQLLVADDRPRAPRKYGSAMRPLPAEPRCREHSDSEATFRCVHCEILWCVDCVHVLKVHGGHGLALCPECSRPCETLLAKDTRELGRMIDELVMVRNAFGPRPQRDHPRQPSDSV